MNDDGLFSQLKKFTHADEDHRGECHITCPKCGKESSTKKPHCSFGEKGWNCFTCGEGGSLYGLAKLLGMTPDATYKAPPARDKKKARKTPDWMKHPEIYVRQYEDHPLKYEMWDEYKTLPHSVIDRRRLGVGVLPKYSSQCRHSRLIVPIIVGTMIVGLRGRAIDCDCGKWLSAEGSTLDMMPLYGVDEIPPAAIIWIVENPIDALIISSSTETSYGVATYGVTYWRDGWTETLKSLCPKMIYVAYDNDLPGNGGAWHRQQMIDAWLLHHKQTPKSNGIRLANDLAAEKLPVKLFDWKGAPEKADIGSVFAENDKTGII